MAGNQLRVIDVESVRGEQARRGDSDSTRDIDEQVQEWVKRLLAAEMADPRAKERERSAVDSLGLDHQREAARQSELLRQPIRVLSARADDKGDVGNALLDLKMTVDKLDPSRIRFEPGPVGRVLARFVGHPVKRYVTRYQSTQSVIQGIIRSLEKSRDQLARDITTLSVDQARMRETARKLEASTALAMKLDEKLSAQLGNPNLSAEKTSFLSEELLFPLRQRVIDLQQQLAVQQQGVLASEIIIRNNRELIRGVNRAINVTGSALQVGATVAIALASQKRVVEKLDAVGKATSEMISATAARLKTQGTEIHRQAASPFLQIDSLRSAFADIQAAMQDLSQFRQAALPQMASTILQFDSMLKEGERAIRLMKKR